MAETGTARRGCGGVTVGGAARFLGTDQLSADQHGQAWPTAGRSGSWRQRDDRLPVEHLADHARPLQDRPLLDVEPIQAGRQQRGHAGRDGDGQVGGGLPSSSERTSNLRSISSAMSSSMNSGLPPAAWR